MSADVGVATKKEAAPPVQQRTKTTGISKKLRTGLMKGFAISVDATLTPSRPDGKRKELTRTRSCSSD